LFESQAAHLKNLIQERGDLSVWVQWLFPLMRRVYPALIGHHLFQASVMSFPVGVLYHLGEGHPFTAEARKLHTQLLSEFPSTACLETHNGVDPEVEYVAAAAADFQMEFDRIQLRALEDCAPRYPIPIGVAFEAAVSRVLQLIRSRVEALRPVVAEATYFVICSPEQAAKLEALPDFLPAAEGERKHAFHVGCLQQKPMGPIDVYEDPFFSPDRALVGLRNGPHDAALGWAPYVMFHRPEERENKSVAFAVREAYVPLDPLLVGCLEGLRWD
jgi:hypothetical protein